MIGINFYVLCCLGRCDVTPLDRVDTIDRADRCDVYWAKLVFKRMLLVPEVSGINDLSFVLSLQLASTSLCYMQLVSKPYSQL